MTVQPCCCVAALLLVVLGACGTTSRPSRDDVKTLPLRQDVEGLRQLVRLPVEVADIQWGVQQIGDGEMGPSDFRLFAGFRLSDANLAALRSRLTLTEANAEFVASLPEGLLPEPPPARADVYDAEPFTKPPYLDGTVWLLPNRRAFLVMVTR